MPRSAVQSSVSRSRMVAPKRAKGAPSPALMSAIDTIGGGLLGGLGSAYLVGAISSFVASQRVATSTQTIDQVAPSSHFRRQLLVGPFARIVSQPVGGACGNGRVMSPPVRTAYRLSYRRRRIPRDDGGRPVPQRQGRTRRGRARPPARPRGRGAAEGSRATQRWQTKPPAGSPRRAAARPEPGQGRNREGAGHQGGPERRFLKSHFPMRVRHRYGASATSRPTAVVRPTCCEFRYQIRVSLPGEHLRTPSRIGCITRKCVNAGPAERLGRAVRQ